MVSLVILNPFMEYWNVIRLFDRMNRPQMPPYVLGCCERLVTDRALVWLVSSVGTQMLLQVMVQRELHSARSALEWPLTRMSHHVRRQLGRLSKVLLANWAFVGLHLGVDQQMLLQVIKTRKWLFTSVAFMWLGSRMDQQVCFQMPNSLEVLLQANVALDWEFTISELLFPRGTRSKGLGTGCRIIRRQVLLMRCVLVRKRVLRSTFLNCIEYL